MTILSGTAVARQTQLEPATSAAVERKPLSGLRVKIYADGADKDAMLEMYANPAIAGFTTNPTLMRK
jgi:hypothetical protein